MSTLIKLRRGSSTQWVSQNTILASGEPGFDLTNKVLKIGDGTSAWTNLSGINSSASSGNFGYLTVLGIPVSVSGHTHVSSDILDFNEAVDDRIGSGLFVAGTGINLNYNDTGNSFTVSVSGLINNPASNRILTSRDSTTTGIDAESNLTFDGSLLSVSGNLIANTGIIDILQLNTNNGAVSAQGQLGWNTTQGTVDLALSTTAIIEIGEHQLYRIRNTTNNTLYRGQPVYASGVHANGLITPNLYIADDSIDEIRFIGLMYETVNNNNNGYVIAFGHMYNIDTRGNVASNIAVGDETWADGDILYPHATVVGKLTKISPKHDIPIALVLNAANNGKIYVRRDLGPGELDDLHNVNVSGVTNGQFLQYNSSTDYWVPTSSGNFTTLQLNGTTVSVSGHTHTSSDITNFNSSVSGLLPSISGSTNINVSSSNNTYTISATGLQTTLTNPITGTGTTNYVSKFTSSSGIGNSIIYDNGTNIGVGTTIPSGQLHVIGSGIFSSGINIVNQTASRIAAFDSAKSIVSLSTATYPSLTELAYVKGVTSDIQTQLNGKSPTVHTHSSDDVSFSDLQLNYIVTDDTLTNVMYNVDTAFDNVYTNFSNYQPLLTNPVTSAPGTVYYIPLFNSSTTIGNSIIYQNANRIAINATVPNATLHVAGSGFFSSGLRIGTTLGTGSNTNTISTAYGLGMHHSGIMITTPESTTDNTIHNSVRLLVSKPNNANGGQTSIDFASRDRGNAVDNGVMAQVIGGNQSGTTNGNGGQLILAVASTGSSVSTPRLTINNNGRVGIGTISPQQLLHVNEASASPGNLFRLQNPSSTSNTYVDFRIGVPGNYDDHFFISRSGTDIIGISSNNRLVLPVTANLFQSKQIISNSNANAFIELQNGANNTHIGYISPNNLLFSASYVEKMRLTSDGKLGIGTTTPTGNLHIVGTGIFSTNVGIGTNAPNAALHVIGNANISGTLSASGIVSGSELTSSQSVGDEGGQINLNVPATNTTISGSVNIDIYQNRLRFFEGTGTNRGFYLDMTTGGAGVSTSLNTPSYLSPAALSTSQGNWNPGAGDIIRVSASTSGVNISGIVLGNEYTRVLINVGSSFNITLKHEASSVTAANRIITPIGGDYIIQPTGSATLLYDTVDSRWRVL